MKTHLLKRSCIELKSCVRREAAGAAAGGLFGPPLVRSAVGAEEELGTAGRDCLYESFPCSQQHDSSETDEGA